jgi:hypothetical protein
MALTLSRVKEAVIGSLKLRVLDVTFDASYPTGGESLTADDLGVDPVFVIAEPTDGFAFEYDKGNEKLIAYEQGFTTGSTAAADSTSGALIEDAAGAETAVRAMGSAINTTYTFGGLREVASTTDLSTVVVRLLAIGV